MLLGQAADIVSELGFENEMDRLSLAIDEWVRGSNEEIEEALRWQFLGGSKYFRPLTVFSCYRALHDRAPPDEVIQAAVAVEMFHNVSLIIDDILDRSRHRRNKLTLHCRFGNLRALMASGYVVADGYQRVAEDRFSFDLLCELMRRLAVAECMQWRLRRKPQGVEDWRLIAGEDTGSMFEVCACLGARTERLRHFGRLLGMLYHGCDDVADVRGVDALGGGGDEDLRDGILTLPAALALRDPEITQIFCDPAEGDYPKLAAAFEAQLPEAERYLDSIADEAREEAKLFSGAPEGLYALIAYTRGLSNR